MFQIFYRTAATVLLMFAASVWAEPVSVCHFYGCKRSFTFDFDAAAQAQIQQKMAQSTDAASERQNAAWAVLQLYLLAAKTYPPLAEDKGGNFHDGSTPGRMDCVDHSSNDSTFLKVLEKHGWLRFHRTNGIVWRAPMLFNLHYTAVLHDNTSSQDWAVDSWFKDFGELPVVVPLDEWKKGYEP